MGERGVRNAKVGGSSPLPSRFILFTQILHPFFIFLLSLFLSFLFISYPFFKTIFNKTYTLFTAFFLMNFTLLTIKIVTYIMKNNLIYKDDEI